LTQFLVSLQWGEKRAKLEKKAQNFLQIVVETGVDWRNLLCALDGKKIVRPPIPISKIKSEKRTQKRGGKRGA